VALGEVISFAKGTPPAPVRVAPPTGDGAWRFALLDSSARSSTLAMIQAAAPYFQGLGGPARLHAFDGAAVAVAQGLATGDAPAVADAMRATGAWLAEAGIVNQELAELTQLAAEAGCLAAKPTGAGGGGCVLALLAPGRAAEQLATLSARIGATRVYAVDLL
jgi:galactokinase/mevalonate kinase-like predicted kinase